MRNCSENSASIAKIIARDQAGGTGGGEGRPGQADVRKDEDEEFIK